MSYDFIYDFLNGQTIEAHNYFGAHAEVRDGQHGFVLP